MEKNVVISFKERCNGQKERCNGKKERCQSPIVWSKMFGPIFSWKYNTIIENKCAKLVFSNFI